ncbi:hypothetical protein C8R46DRAFT_1067924 [Mycena filopes]|nr:hypothetical protein C8R46DRAFT_1067924 [Mycena filopes]
MVMMYTSDDAGNNMKHGFPPFRNPCGRRGCGHIFEYDGPNPLGNIQRLVFEHLDHCRGQSPLATRLLRGRSQQNIGERQPREWEEYGYGRTGASLSPRSYQREWSSSPTTLDDDEGSDDDDTPQSTGSAPKKSARTEAERRRTLEDDPWTLEVTPHEVVCRGCRRTIKLDRRSRYYPGLWEKHRDRCDHVVKIRDLTREPEEDIVMQQPIEEPPIASSSRLRTDPSVLPPRKSYYRNM